MLWPLLVAAALLLCALLSFGVAIQFIVLMVRRMILGASSLPGYWRGTAAMAVVTLITAAAHLTQIALWAAALRLCGVISTWDTAFYLSAQNYTALGYGDIPLPERWRLLGPLEAVNGLLFFGLSTAVLFAVLSRLVTGYLRTETDDPGAAPGDREPRSVAGAAGPG
jgi:hypothetical protein